MFLRYSSAPSLFCPNPEKDVFFCLTPLKPLTLWIFEAADAVDSGDAVDAADSGDAVDAVGLGVMPLRPLTPSKQSRRRFSHDTKEAS